MTDIEKQELVFPDWRKWSLEQKVSYVKGSSGGFNLKRADIAELDDNSRQVHYKMKTIRMAVNVIDIQGAELLSARKREKMLNRGVDLLQWLHGKYADKNLSFDDNWFAEVQDYFTYDYKAKETLSKGDK
jgi:hypothetical protein